MAYQAFPRPSDEVTAGWRFVSIGFQDARVSLDGLNPWEFEWQLLDLPPITVAHPDYPKERHHMMSYEIRTEGRIVRFAAGEFSNGVYGFYVPEGAPKK